MTETDCGVSITSSGSLVALRGGSSSRSPSTTMPGAAAALSMASSASAGAAANRQGASAVQASRRAAGEAVGMNDFLNLNFPRRYCELLAGVKASENHLQIKP